VAKIEGVLGQGVERLDAEFDRPLATSDASGLAIFFAGNRTDRHPVSGVGSDAAAAGESSFPPFTFHQ